MQRDRKGEMVRLAALNQAVVADFAARLAGRGGYLHRRPECLKSFVASKVAVFRSLKRRISPQERRLIAQSIEARLESGSGARIN